MAITSTSGRSQAAATFALLAAVMAAQGELSGAELAERIGEPQNRINRLLTAAEAEGWAVVRHGRASKIELRPPGTAIVI